MKFNFFLQIRIGYGNFIFKNSLQIPQIYSVYISLLLLVNVQFVLISYSFQVPKWNCLYLCISIENLSFFNFCQSLTLNKILWIIKLITSLLENKLAIIISIVYIFSLYHKLAKYRYIITDSFLFLLLYL